MSEESDEPTNAELRVHLLALAYNQTQQSYSRVLHQALDRINDLTAALEELHIKAVVGTDEERHGALTEAWAVLYKALGPEAASPT